jgi:hypothetical protein
MTVFAAAFQAPVHSLVSADLFLHSRREQIVSHAAKHALPAMYPRREYVSAGLLMCYGLIVKCSTEPT